MAKGSYQGGGTVIGPRDVSWYGKSGVKGGTRPDADDIARRQATPLTPQAEQRISNLRIHLTGLQRELGALDRARDGVNDKIARSKQELASLLHEHGLPLDPDLAKAKPAKASQRSGKTTRNQRRKRARKRFEARRQKHD